jgi:hypothetical protein
MSFWLVCIAARIGLSEFVLEPRVTKLVHGSRYSQYAAPVGIVQKAQHAQWGVAMKPQLEEEEHRLP